MTKIIIRPASSTDLTGINRVIAAAINNWPCAARLKRLAIPVICYDRTDLDHYQFLVAMHHQEVVGVAAWDPNSIHPLPAGQGGLFHGLYVLPLVQGQGIGRILMDRVFDAARQHQVSGLLIKAQRVSRRYFEHQAMEPIASNDNNYPWQYWKRLA